MGITFFHTPKPKRFEIKPRYYDPQKEEWEQRKKELGIAGDTDKEYLLRSRIHQKWGTERRLAKKRTDLRRLVIFILITLLLVYLLFIR
jgi:hypothetical protein